MSKLLLTSRVSRTARITSLSAEQFKDDQTGIEVNGFNFGSSTGTVTLETQGRNVADTSISQTTDTISANQTITDWTSSKITFTCVLPTYRTEDWPGWYQLKVTPSGGSTLTFENYVLVGPNQTVAGTEQAGFALIQTSDTFQTVVNAEAAGTAFLLEAGTFEQFSVTRRNGDKFVASNGTILDGGKDISTSWTDEGTGSWSLGGQTQADSLPATNRIETNSFTGSWDEQNNANQEFYIGLSTQTGPLCRIRRDASQAAIEAAGSNSATLASNPIETESGSNLVWISDTSTGATGGITFGEAIKLSGADAVGGITVDGWYTAIQTDTVNNRFMIWHPTAATSSATGGGGSITREKDVRCFFDSGGDIVYINTDPNASNTVIRASVELGAFRDTSQVLTGFHLRGHPENYLEVRHYASEHFEAAVQAGTGGRIQYLYIHHTHGKAFEAGGSDVELWDYQGWWNGKAGFNWSADTPFIRRIDSRFNNTAHYDNQEHGAGKIASTDGLDLDQAIIALNFGNGLWIDINNNFSSDGVRRVDAWDNAKTGIFIENNQTLTAEGNFYNSLLRDNSWYQMDSGWASRLRANNLYVKSTEGTASFNMIVRDNKVEVRDGQTAEANNPTHGIVIKPHLNQEPTRYIIIQNNIVVYKGNSAGTSQSGFYSFDNDAGNTQAEMDGMNSTSDWTLNTYYTADASGTAIFGYMEGPANFLTRTAAQWQAGTGMDHALDDDGTFNFSQSAGELAAQIADWTKGDMPTWNDVQAL